MIRVRLLDPLSCRQGPDMRVIALPYVTIEASKNELRKLRKQYLKNVAAIDRALGEP